MLFWCVFSAIGCLPLKRRKVYFKNLMYRLVLHSGSHKEEYVKAMKELSFFAYCWERGGKNLKRYSLFYLLLEETAFALTLKRYWLKRWSTIGFVVSRYTKADSDNLRNFDFNCSFTWSHKMKLQFILPVYPLLTVRHWTGYRNEKTDEKLCIKEDTLTKLRFSKLAFYIDLIRKVMMFLDMGEIPLSSSCRREPFGT